MSVKKFPPFMGMDNRSEDAAMERGGDDARIYVRDALNVDFTSTGRLALRKGLGLDSELPFKYLWQSPLHQDCFAVLNGMWVKIDTQTWNYQELADVGRGPVDHHVVNNQVFISSDAGLFYFDGMQAQRLTIETPAPVQIQTEPGGSLSAGDYAVAISWLRHDLESALSALVSVAVGDNSLINMQLPYCMDRTVTRVRIYLTEANGGELRQYADFPIDQLQIKVMSVTDLTRTAQFQYRSPMKSGKFLRLWRGRLLTVKSNVLYFSEAMAFHLMDERYNFVQFPQRITFIEPVDGGIWVGQSDHVVFLRGNDMRNMDMEPKSSRAPVPESSMLLHADETSVAQGGAAVALWLAENGYVLGSADGQLIEVQADHLKGISAKQGGAVSLDRRIFAIVN